VRLGLGVGGSLADVAAGAIIDAFGGRAPNRSG
jgi:hypothetical protein